MNDFDKSRERKYVWGCYEKEKGGCVCVYIKLANILKWRRQRVVERKVKIIIAVGVSFVCVFYSLS